MTIRHRCTSEQLNERVAAALGLLQRGYGTALTSRTLSEKFDVTNRQARNYTRTALQTMSGTWEKSRIRVATTMDLSEHHPQREPFSQCVSAQKNPVPGYVYVIKYIGMKLYKIGMTINLEQRMRTLEEGTTTTLISYLEVPDPRKVEAEAHEKYSEYRLPGSEYFVLPHPPVIP